MVDIQSATAEIRRGRKERRKKKQDENIMFASATQGGHDRTKRELIVVLLSAVNIK